MFKGIEKQIPNEPFQSSFIMMAICEMMTQNYGK